MKKTLFALAIAACTPAPAPTTTAPAPAPIPTPTATPTAPQIAAASDAGDDDDAGADAGDVVVRGPLTAQGGTVTLAGKPDGGWSITVAQGSTVRPFGVVLGDVGGAPQPRVVDLDQDGRSDALFYTPGGGEDLPTALAYLVPDLTTWDGGESPGEASFLRHAEMLELAMAGATSADDAIARAHAIPRGRPTVQQACGLLKSATNAATLRAISTPDARVVFYHEPDGVTGVRTIAKVADLKGDDLAQALGQIGNGCPGKEEDGKKLTCDSVPAGCTFLHGPDFNFYLFAMDGGRPRLAQVAIYTGS